MIRAIPTVYKGVTFRSRNEARYAVFFDTVGIKWDYEIEGFEFDTDGRIVRYLPDFWLSDYDMWFEVKGYAPTEIDAEKAYLLCLHMQKRVCIAYGGLRPFSYEIKGFEQVSLSGAFGILIDPRGVHNWGTYANYVENNESLLSTSDTRTWAIEKDTGKIIYASVEVYDDKHVYVFGGLNHECMDATDFYQYMNDGKDILFKSPTITKAFMTAQTKKFEFADKEQW